MGAMKDLAIQAAENLDAIVGALLFRGLHSEVLSRTIDICKLHDCGSVDVESALSVRAWLPDGSQGWHVSLIDMRGEVRDYVRVVELDRDGQPVVDTEGRRDFSRSFSEY